MLHGPINAVYVWLCVWILCISKHLYEDEVLSVHLHECDWVICVFLCACMYSNPHVFIKYLPVLVCVCVSVCILWHNSSPHEQCWVYGYIRVAINHRDKHWIFVLGKWLVPAEMSVCSPPATYLCLQHNLPMPLGEDTQKHRHIGTDNLEHPGTKSSGFKKHTDDDLQRRSPRSGRSSWSGMLYINMWLFV